ncbi:permease [Vibrio sp. PP-XX7]
MDYVERASSKSATTAFLISTPETGIDSIAISYALLGPLMAIIRPIAALSSAIVAATLVLLGEKIAIADHTADDSIMHNKDTKCGDSFRKHQQLPLLYSSTQTTRPRFVTSRIWQGQIYSFTELLGDLSVWLVVGLLASACVVALVPNDTLAEISQGGWAMLVMALIGVPMYICASASTPLPLD